MLTVCLVNSVIKGSAGPGTNDNLNYRGSKKCVLQPQSGYLSCKFNVNAAWSAVHVVSDQQFFPHNFCFLFDERRCHSSGHRASDAVIMDI